jgi:murein L,D-transpeptidase YcbB/YkuD
MIREQFMQALDSAGQHGLDKERYHYSDLKERLANKDTASLMEVDKMFTDGIIAYSRDVYQGGDITNRLSSDEVTAKHGAGEDDLLLKKLLAVTSVPAVEPFLTSLERNEPVVKLLEDKLKTSMHNKSAKVDQLKVTLNTYRWIKHFNFDKYIVVNIPAATLRVYEGDEVKLEMKVVVGKPTTKTPRFSSYCREVILYPYWNVPKGIATKELLPKFRDNPDAFEAMHLQVVDAKGRVVSGINVSNYSGYFPYTFRQYTGCENALGVVKFNLTDPFDVYMHDTNNKQAFKKESRFLSHGCIRLEKPIDLANELLPNDVDAGFLKACVHGQSPISKRVPEAVPVFVLYMTADVVHGGVKYYKDVYNLM